ncbi:MAG: hypothetical protein ACR2P7_05250 [bacterium]
MPPGVDEVEIRARLCYTNAYRLRVARVCSRRRRCDKHKPSVTDMKRTPNFRILSIASATIACMLSVASAAVAEEEPVGDKMRERVEGAPGDYTYSKICFDSKIAYVPQVTSIRKWWNLGEDAVAWTFAVSKNRVRCVELSSLGWENGQRLSVWWKNRRGIPVRCTNNSLFFYGKDSDRTMTYAIEWEADPKWINSEIRGSDIYCRPPGELRWKPSETD